MWNSRAHRWPDGEDTATFVKAIEPESRDWYVNVTSCSSSKNVSLMSASTDGEFKWCKFVRVHISLSTPQHVTLRSNRCFDFTSEPADRLYLIGQRLFSSATLPLNTTQAFIYKRQTKSEQTVFTASSACVKYNILPASKSTPQLSI